MKPRIAIPLPTSEDLEYNERNWPNYAEAVRQAGGEPVEVPLSLTPGAIAELANTCQGILLPGSPADVNPAKYGEQPLATTAATDLPRENVDELLLQDAHNMYKPLLGICFGAQILNVWRTGSLVQHLESATVNHGDRDTDHAAEVTEGSLLAAVVGQAAAGRSGGPTVEGGRIGINSSHHQAIGVPGDGLRVSARSPEDGVVEAIEGGQAHAGTSRPAAHPEHFVLGVQWHPERSFQKDAVSSALFQRFVHEAAAWKPRLVLASVAG